jgi:DNA polymerase V
MSPEEMAPACGVPLFLVSVSAGFPSPAEDYLDGKLDLNEYLIKHRAATFFLRAAGDSMTGAGIHNGDILIVDRSLDPVDDNIVIAVLDGELTVKRIRKSAGELLLLPENAHYKPVRVTEEMDIAIWGVVTNVIHSLC